MYSRPTFSRRALAEGAPGAHPVFAAYMDMRYSRNMARDEAREKVIPAYMGLITQIDDQMGVLMRFLTSAASSTHDDRVHLDHGDYLGDHWMGEKDLFHEQSAKIPLIVIDPSREADATRGTVCDALVEAIDLAPTFVDSFGGKVPTHILEGARCCRCCAASSRRTGADTCSPNTTMRCRTCG
jgi:arylsulfatase A-like enzyme